MKNILLSSLAALVATVFVAEMAHAVSVKAGVRARVNEAQTGTITGTGTSAMPVVTGSAIQAGASATDTGGQFLQVTEVTEANRGLIAQQIIDMGCTGSCPAAVQKALDTAEVAAPPVAQTVDAIFGETVSTKGLTGTAALEGALNRRGIAMDKLATCQVPN